MFGPKLEGHPLDVDILSVSISRHFILPGKAVHHAYSENKSTFPIRMSGRSLND
jgi:hypothetical protein